MQYLLHIIYGKSRSYARKQILDCTLICNVLKGQMRNLACQLCKLWMMNRTK